MYSCGAGPVQYADVVQLSCNMFMQCHGIQQGILCATYAGDAAPMMQCMHVVQHLTCRYV
jgi:hypothetical protein